MSFSKITDLKGLTTEEQSSLLKASQTELIQLAMKRRVNALSDTSQLKKLRHKIAQLSMLLAQPKHSKG